MGATHYFLGPQAGALNPPGLLLKTQKTPLWATKVHTSSSGLESRIALQSTPRYRYSVEIEFLRNRATLTEATDLLAFLNARYGSFDFFNFYDKLQVTPGYVYVRFEDDGFTFKEFASGFWSANLKLISLK